MSSLVIAISLSMCLFKFWSSFFNYSTSANNLSILLSAVHTRSWTWDLLLIVVNKSNICLNEYILFWWRLSCLTVSWSPFCLSAADTSFSPFVESTTSIHPANVSLHPWSSSLVAEWVKSSYVDLKLSHFSSKFLMSSLILPFSYRSVALWSLMALFVLSSFISMSILRS